MRLDKFICKSTELTRTQAKRLLKTKQVMVDNVIAVSGALQINEHQQIRLSGQLLALSQHRYLMLNKPLATICSNVDEQYPSILHCLDVPRAFDLRIAGRLDADTTGLVLLTDDGQWLHNVISPNKHCYKRYRVTLGSPISNDALQQLAQGVPLHGEKVLTQPAKVSKISDTEILLSIFEGKYHQVKRMLAAVGNSVIALHREQIGEITLTSDLAAGQWRSLTEDEIEHIQT